MRNNNTKIGIAICGLIVSVLITVPVIYGYITSPVDKKFLGITGLYPVEQFYYLSMGPSQAAKGNLFFTDKYGRIPDESVLFNPVGNIIDLISRIFNTSLSVSFNIFRLFAALFLVFSFYYLSKQFICSETSILLSVFFYCFSAGFDSLFHLLNFSRIDAVDDSMPEANMFVAMSGEYYLPLANALFILTLTFGYNLLCGQVKRSILWYGLSIFLLGAVYVYGLITVIFILSAVVLYFGYRQNNIGRQIFGLVKLSVFCLPVAGYYLWLIFHYPRTIDEGWYSSPDFFALLSTFGFGFLFATLGLFTKNKSALNDLTFLLLWVITTLFLIYLPQTFLHIQNQMLIGLGAPLSILSGVSLENISKFLSGKFPKLRERQKSILFVIISASIIIASGSTNIQFYKNEFMTLKKKELPTYMDSRVYAGMEWTSKNISEKNLVIISRKLGFIFSSVTACNVYTGTASFKQKTPQQELVESSLNLLRENKTEEAKRILLQTNGDYLFLDSTLAGIHFEGLRQILKTIYPEIFQNAAVSIFKLK